MAPGGGSIRLACDRAAICRRVHVGTGERAAAPFSVAQLTGIPDRGRRSSCHCRSRCVCNPVRRWRELEPEPAGIRPPFRESRTAVKSRERRVIVRGRSEQMLEGAIPSSFSLSHRLGRALWSCVYLLLFRPTPRVACGWRRGVLRAFGAKLGKGAVVHPSVRIWAPWNLRMGDYATLAPGVICYNVATITLEARAVVSQYSFLCSASHDYSDLRLPLTHAPIRIEAQAWVCADVYVGPGVRIGEGAVVAARSSVYRDVPPWKVVAGNPARYLKDRVLKSTSCSA